MITKCTYMCEFCNRTFSIKKDCQEHEKTHKVRENYMEKNKFKKVVKCCGTCEFYNGYCTKLADLKAHHDMVHEYSVCGNYKESGIEVQDILDYYNPDDD